MSSEDRDYTAPGSEVLEAILNSTSRALPSRTTALPPLLLFPLASLQLSRFHTAPHQPSTPQYTFPVSYSFHPASHRSPFFAPGTRSATNSAPSIIIIRWRSQKLSGQEKSSW